MLTNIIQQSETENLQQEYDTVKRQIKKQIKKDINKEKNNKYIKLEKTLVGKDTREIWKALNRQGAPQGKRLPVTGIEDQNGKKAMTKKEAMMNFYNHFKALSNDPIGRDIEAFEMDQGKTITKLAKKNRQRN